jgi:transcriptional antiterminator NusG
MSSKLNLDFTGIQVANESKPDQKWYLVSTQSNCEAKAIDNMKIQVAVSKREESFSCAICPAVEIVEMRGGQKRKRVQKLYPSYIMVQCEMDAEMYNVVTRAGKVTGFLNKRPHQPLPLPMSSVEVGGILDKLSGINDGTEGLVGYQVGEVVTLLSGAFQGFTGAISAVNGKAGTVKVSLQILGRATDLEIGMGEIESASD